MAVAAKSVIMPVIMPVIMSVILPVAVIIVMIMLFAGRVSVRLGQFALLQQDMRGCQVSLQGERFQGLSSFESFQSLDRQGQIC